MNQNYHLIDFDLYHDYFELEEEFRKELLEKSGDLLLDTDYTSFDYRSLIYNNKKDKTSFKGSEIIKHLNGTHIFRLYRRKKITKEEAEFLLDKADHKRFTDSRNVRKFHLPVNSIRRKQAEEIEYNYDYYVKACYALSWAIVEVAGTKSRKTETVSKRPLRVWGFSETINGWWRGKNPIPTYALIKLSKISGIPIEEIEKHIVILKGMSTAKFAVEIKKLPLKLDEKFITLASHLTGKLNISELSASRGRGPRIRGSYSAPTHEHGNIFIKQLEDVFGKLIYSLETKEEIKKECWQCRTWYSSKNDQESCTCRKCPECDVLYEKSNTDNCPVCGTFMKSGEIKESKSIAVKLPIHITRNILNWVAKIEGITPEEVIQKSKSTDKRIFNIYKKYPITCLKTIYDDNLAAIYSKRIKLYANNSKLTEEIKSLLTSIEIERPTIDIPHPSSYGYPNSRYICLDYVKDIRKFHKKIGFRYSYDQKRLEDMVNNLKRYINY